MQSVFNTKESIMNRLWSVLMVIVCVLAVAACAPVR